MWGSFNRQPRPDTDQAFTGVTHEPMGQGPVKVAPMELSQKVRDALSRLPRLCGQLSLNKLLYISLKMLLRFS